jgi:hypothetical protein
MGPLTLLVYKHAYLLQKDYFSTYTRCSLQERRKRKPKENGPYARHEDSSGSGDSYSHSLSLQWKKVRG